MKIVFDIEANGLRNPTEIWVVVCKDVITCQRYIFRNLTSDENERIRFLAWAPRVDLWIGHNVLQYDFPVMEKLLGLVIPVEKILDTFILSKLIDYPREKHSINHYGEEFGLPKGDIVDFSQYTKPMEDYCIRDVAICHRIYSKYLSYVNKPEHASSIKLEHEFQLIVNGLHSAGFALDTKKATKLLERVCGELEVLDKEILEAFPPRLKFIREISPKGTKFDTINLSSIPKRLRDSIHEYSIGAAFCHCGWVSFNPASHKQIVTVLNEAGWRPEDKTDTHKDTERKLNQLRRLRRRGNEFDTEIKVCEDSLIKLAVYGWKLNENNLATLPASAPPAALLLAKRILREARRRTLTEWLNLVQDDGRVHGEFQGIGAWTHRMSHQKPNMANVTNAVRVSDGKTSFLGKELRSCWHAPKGRLLIGVDAEAIQLRVFAHLINDPVLTDAIVNGNKKLGTDPHSLNKKYFGEYCKTRNAAKHSLYAMFFGGSASMVSHIMDCTKGEAQEAIDALTQKYPGLQELKKEVFPRDARRGYFIGLDGRKVRIPGETVRDREHLCMSGYLQNGEKVIMASATLEFSPQLHHYDTFLIDLVHDEWQNEGPNDLQTCIAVAELECQSLVKVGIYLGLNCPLAGSYRNDNNEYTIGRNWYETH